MLILERRCLERNEETEEEAVDQAGSFHGSQEKKRRDIPLEIKDAEATIHGPEDEKNVI